jgi:hypothetical protein
MYMFAYNGTSFCQTSSGSSGGITDAVTAYQNAAGLSVADAASIQFDATAANSTPGMHSTSSNKQRLTAVNTGWHVATCLWNMTNSPGGSHYGTMINIDNNASGLAHGGGDSFLATGVLTGGSVPSLTAFVYLVAGDSINCSIHSGGNATIGTGENVSSFSMHRITN